MSGRDGGALTPRRYILASISSVAWMLLHARVPPIPRRVAEHAPDRWLSTEIRGLSTCLTASVTLETGFSRGYGRQPGYTCHIKDRPRGMNDTTTPSTPGTASARTTARTRWTLQQQLKGGLTITCSRLGCAPATRPRAMVCLAEFQFEGEGIRLGRTA